MALTVGSAIAALATSAGPMIAAQAAQGVGGGVLARFVEIIRADGSLARGR